MQRPHPNRNPIYMVGAWFIRLAGVAGAADVSGVRFILTGEGTRSNCTTAHLISNIF